MTPPHDLTAEKAVLGASLLSAVAYDDAEDAGLVSDDFYSPAHAHVWDSVRRLVSTGVRPDVVTVQADLASHGLLDHVGGVGTLLELQGSSGGYDAAGHYAALVVRAARLRRLLAAATDISNRAAQPVEDVEAFLAWAEAAMGQATEHQATSRPETAGQMMAAWQARLEAPAPPVGIPTPWEHLNRITGGLRPGMTVVFARPGCGKSAWGMNVAVQAALHGYPTLLCSLEMDRPAIADRLVAYRSGINHTLIRDRKMGERDRLRANASAEELRSLPLHVHDGFDVTVAKVASAARRVADLALLIIDYAQLLRPATAGRRSDNRQTEVAAVSQELVRLRRRLGIPVVALAQSNRPTEASKGPPPRPTVRDIRETGQLENDADLVLSLFRDEMGNPKSKQKGTMEMVIHKHRHGSTGEKMLVGWDGPTFRISDLAGAF